MKKRELLKQHKKLIIAAALLAVVTMGSTVAYLADQTGFLINRFEQAPSKIETEIKEETEGRKEPWVVNVGETTALIRMRVTVTPMNESEYPTEAQLLTELGASWSENWKRGDDGFWYWQGALEAGSDSKTDSLFLLPLQDGSGAANEKLLAYLKENPNFDITLYHEACPTYAIIDGQRINAVKGGVYNQERAEQIWAYYSKDANPSR